MSISSLLRLVFRAEAFAGIAYNAASPETSIAVALHTADPAEIIDSVWLLPSGITQRSAGRS
jgi:hypothetical protein